jgi:ABC-2 type transport system ATP-binding protein
VAELARQVLGGCSHEIRVEADGADLHQALAAVPGVKSVRVDADGGYILQAEADVRAQAAQAAVLAGARLRGLAVSTPSLDRIYHHTFAEDPAS